MTNSIDDITQQLIDRIADATHDEDVSTNVKNLKIVADAKQILEPPTPELEDQRGFFARHAGDLIKAGTTLTAVVVIAVIEAKGDVIFRSKATKYL